MTRARHSRLYELLTGEPCDPEAQVKAAIAFAQVNHAKRLNLRADLRASVHAALARAS